MAFGKNPHVARAQAAEQKARDASDASVRERAYRDAAHQWDRAAEREPSDKRRAEYEQNALQNRALAEEPASLDEPEAAPVVEPAGDVLPVTLPTLDPRTWN